MVGYGAAPNESVEWSRQNLSAIVRGNHDKVSVGLDDTEGYNTVAAASLYWTANILTEPNRAYLREMPRGPIEHSGFWLMHGSPVDEDLYLIQECDARDMEQFLRGPLNFFGHTHRQGGFTFLRRTLRPIPQVPELETSYPLQIDSEAQYLINPGSVGQPRDADWRAAYCIYNQSTATITYYRAAYDVESAAKSIHDAGLPELLARRLFLGK